MIGEKEIAELIDRIEDRNALGTSPTYSRLLRYLTAQTLSGDIPKEQSIAEHLFGKTAAKSDTSKIRVYVYHLRKKLYQYFEENGADEAYILRIPKGGYKVEFVATQDQDTEAVIEDDPYERPFLPKWLWPVLGLLAFGNLYWLAKLQKAEEVSKEISPIWADIFENDKPLQIVIGDLFVYSDVSGETSEGAIIRHPLVNTREQFEQQKSLAESQNRELSAMPYSHLSMGSVEWISSLTRLIGDEQDFSIRFATQLEAQDLHDYNFIFVGMQKTANIFNSYFDKSQIQYDPEVAYTYGLTREGIIKNYEPEGDPKLQHEDYGLIVKYPGPNDNVIFMFSGLFDTATSEAIRTFVTPTKLDDIEREIVERLGRLPPYFEMLIAVNGMDRIGFESEIIHIVEIEE